MRFLRRIIKRFEDEMAAAAVAQHGDYELALQIIRESEEGLEHKDLSKKRQEMMHLTTNPVEGK
ncbi:MAG TPA: hypothetical protein ENK09_11625 [Nitrospirae bacterium]|nr:hypothetical protein [Nitrospirota bacterium]